MPTFTLEVIEKHYKTVEVEASTIEEAKEKVLDKCSHYEDDKDRVTIEIYNEDWLEI